MKKFSKILENDNNIEYYGGKFAFNIFLDIIDDLDLMFLKHDYYNQGEYLYFFTSEKIEDNYNLLNILKRKNSLKHAYYTLLKIQNERLSFYFGVKNKTLIYGFHNDDTQYVYKVGNFKITNSYLKKLKRQSTKHIKNILENVNLTKIIKLHEIKKDLLTFFDTVDGEIIIKEENRILKKFKIKYFKSDDVDEGRLNYTIMSWSKKFKWSKNVYTWSIITDDYIFFYIKLKEKHPYLNENINVNE